MWSARGSERESTARRNPYDLRSRPSANSFALYGTRYANHLTVLLHVIRRTARRGWCKRCTPPPHPPAPRGLKHVQYLAKGVGRLPSLIHPFLYTLRFHVSTSEKDNPMPLLLASDMTYAFNLLPRRHAWCETSHILQLKSFISRCIFSSC